MYPISYASRVVALLLSVVCGNTSAATRQLCQPFDFQFQATSTPPLHSLAQAPTPVVFALHEGRLQPQVERLLRERFAVTTIEWRASPHFRWSSDYLLSAESWTQALTHLLQPYGLKAVLYANHSAVIVPEQEAAL
ncbi:hypothetical protein [Pseudidiomarina sediminum]|uniref:hypothetical protein n=1 Tax=Pseudidiomarina sediminum TaxID=431675 RepID=UPI001C982647|nr:hypothetical protein [Pseudidiomarina sediminum]MBY6063498.1 hypothetical protein [Pseudidiomarina sediminum]